MSSRIGVLLLWRVDGRHLPNLCIGKIIIVSSLLCAGPDSLNWLFELNSVCDRLFFKLIVLLLLHLFIVLSMIFKLSLFFKLFGGLIPKAVFLQLLPELVQGYSLDLKKGYLQILLRIKLGSFLLHIELDLIGLQRRYLISQSSFPHLNNLIQLIDLLI